MTEGRFNASLKTEGKLIMNLNLLEQVNPVFNTAKMTVFQLASMGDKDAAEIVGKLNLTFEETQNSSTSKTSPELMALNNIMLETRYRTSVAIAQHIGYQTFVDLPCGYTP